MQVDESRKVSTGTVKHVPTKIACKPIFDSHDLLDSSPFDVAYIKYKVITSMLHSYNKCEVITSMLLDSSPFDVAYNKYQVITSMLKCEVITSMLLDSSPFDVAYNKYEVITSMLKCEVITSMLHSYKIWPS